MPDSTATQCLLFSDLSKKPVVLAFDQRQGSSDGGAVLLQAAYRRYGLMDAMAACLGDRRQAGKVEHSLVELLRQRIYGLACGYADANDAARLDADPIHKLLADRDPVVGRDLASQSTLSRFENVAGPQALYRMGMELARCVIERHGKRLGGHARRITIDFDPTDDATHGAQQLSFFNAHYDSWCYLPMMGLVSFGDEPDQYLCAELLRPGNVAASAGAIGVLRRLIRLVRTSFPKARIRTSGTLPGRQDFADWLGTTSGWPQPWPPCITSLSPASSSQTWSEHSSKVNSRF